MRRAMPAAPCRLACPALPPRSVSVDRSGSETRVGGPSVEPSGMLLLFFLLFS
jgi:hypothetical protein